MDTKPTYKSEIVLVATLLTAILPVVLEKMPADSVWVAVLGAVLAGATYIAGRQLRVASDNKAQAMLEATKAAAANPSQPST